VSESWFGKVATHFWLRRVNTTRGSEGEKKLISLTEKDGRFFSAALSPVAPAGMPDKCCQIFSDIPFMKHTELEQGPRRRKESNVIFQIRLWECWLGKDDAATCIANYCRRLRGRVHVRFRMQFSLRLACKSERKNRISHPTPIDPYPPRKQNC
jgi:hypothetical protein